MNKHKKHIVSLEILRTQSFLRGSDLELIETEETIKNVAVYTLDDSQTYIIAYDALVAGRKVTNTLKIGYDKFSWVGIGDTHSRQQFEKGKWHSGQFYLGSSVIQVRNFTKTLDYAITPSGGLIDLVYELWSGDTHLGFYNYEFYLAKEKR